MSPLYYTDEPLPEACAVWRRTLNDVRHHADSLLVNVDDWDAYYWWLRRNDPRGPMTSGVLRGVLFRGVECIEHPDVQQGECRIGGAVCQLVIQEPV